MSLRNLPFNFTKGGYQKPSFNNVPFNWTALSSANLQAAINVLGVYQDSTYTYLKECPTYTIAYGGTIQIIKLPCIYGGIRDIGAYIYSNPLHLDLPAYIFVEVRFHNLRAYIKSTTQAIKDLGAYLESVPPVNLNALIHGYAVANLPAIIGGYASLNLPASIGAHPPADLNAILNVIEIFDLPASILGELYKGQADLGAIVNKIFQVGYKNLGAILQGWQVLDLPATIGVVYKWDLNAIIQSSSVFNLQALLNAVAPVNLPANVHGYATKDLLAYILGGFGPGDIQASIFGIGPKDLNAYIEGFKGVEIPFDLPAILLGTQEFDLNAIIGIIDAANLGAIINATGGALNLPATIIPNVLRLKRAINVSLLEHTDLRAMINFQCFSSGFRNLHAYLYPIYKHDLSAVIWGWKTDDGYANLAAYINGAEYNVEDKFTLTMVPDVTKFTSLRLKFGSYSSYYVEDTLPVYFNSYPAYNLSASINGILQNYDLLASITPLIQANYTELSPGITAKSHETVIKFSDKGIPIWEKEVEIVFDKAGADPFRYFYVDDEAKVYRTERGRHWQIRVSAYHEDLDDFIERYGMRTKYVYGMSKYGSIDEAIRDLIDRTSTYRMSDIGARITCIPPVMYNLGAEINPIVVKSWVKSLGASITGIT